MNLPLARKMLRHAQRAFDEMVVAQEDSDVFEYRFVACLALLSAVGAVIDDEVTGHKKPSFAAWWTGIDASQPLRAYLSSMRNLELKRGQSTKTLLTRARHPVPSVRNVVRTRRRPTVVPGQVVTQSIIEEGITRPASRAVTIDFLWAFRTGPYAGMNVVPLIQQHIDWIDGQLIPGAESHTT